MLAFLCVSMSSFEDSKTSFELIHDIDPIKLILLYNLASCHYWWRIDEPFLPVAQKHQRIGPLRRNQALYKVYHRKCKCHIMWQMEKLCFGNDETRDKITSFQHAQNQKYKTFPDYVNNVQDKNPVVLITAFPFKMYLGKYGKLKYCIVITLLWYINRTMNWYNNPWFLGERINNRCNYTP